jgi:hypothetical protein
MCNQMRTSSNSLGDLYVGPTNLLGKLLKIGHCQGHGHKQHHTIWTMHHSLQQLSGHSPLVSS